MSGYENSPDYGGPEPKRHDWIKPILLIAVIALVIWGLSQYGKWFDRTGGPIEIMIRSFKQ